MYEMMEGCTSSASTCSIRATAAWPRPTSRTSPILGAEVRQAIDRAIDYAIGQMHAVMGESPITQLVPIPLIAELGAAAFLGIEVLAQNGRDIDLDRLAATLAAAVQLVGSGKPET